MCYSEMDSDEYFDEIIEIDFGDVSDKENENNKSPNGHSSKTINVKKEQFELIARVMNGKTAMYFIISHFIDIHRRQKTTRY